MIVALLLLVSSPVKVKATGCDRFTACYQQPTLRVWTDRRHLLWLHCLYVLCRVSGPVTGTLPASYSSWSSLKAFELGDTLLSGTFPAVYASSWPALENFTRGPDVWRSP